MNVGIGSSGAPTRRIVEIEGIVDTLHRAHVEIDPLHRLVGSVIDGVRMAQARRRARGPFQRGGAAIDRKLGFAVEDDEHLLALVVEMGADAALGLDHAAVHEKQIGFQRLGIEQRPIVQRTRAIMHRLHVAILRRVGVGDSLLQRRHRYQRGLLSQQTSRVQPPIKERRLFITDVLLLRPRGGRNPSCARTI